MYLNFISIFIFYFLNGCSFLDESLKYNCDVYKRQTQCDNNSDWCKWDTNTNKCVCNDPQGYVKM